MQHFYDLSLFLIFLVELCLIVISCQHPNRLPHRQFLPYCKVGKYNLIAKEDLSRWIQKQTNMNLTEWRASVE